MANNNPCTEQNNQERPPFKMTYELQVNMEDRLLQLFSAVIDLDAADREFPIWGDTTNQLMEVAWTLSKMRRIIDHDTHRPMTMHRIATLLCQNLHRRMPSNIYSVARQSRMSGRRPWWSISPGCGMRAAWTPASSYSGRNPSVFLPSEATVACSKRIATYHYSQHQALTKTMTA